MERIYRKRDLDLDATLLGRPRSLAGHWLRPYVDFGEWGESLRWYTIMRKPKARSFSQYVQDLDHGYVPQGTCFKDWMRIPARGLRNQNAQVKQICGKEDAESAKEILRKSFSFVGIMEDYDMTIRLLKKILVPGICLSFSRPLNQRKSENRLSVEMDRQPDLDMYLMEHNTEDILLYDFVVDELYPKFKAGEESPRDIPENSPTLEPMVQRYNLWVNFFKRNLFYKTVVRIDRGLSPNK